MNKFAAVIVSGAITLSIAGSLFATQQPMPTVKKEVPKDWVNARMYRASDQGHAYLCSEKPNEAGLFLCAMFRQVEQPKICKDEGYKKPLRCVEPGKFTGV